MGGSCSTQSSPFESALASTSVALHSQIQQLILQLQQERQKVKALEAERDELQQAVSVWETRFGQYAALLDQQIQKVKETTQRRRATVAGPVDSITLEQPSRPTRSESEPDTNLSHSAPTVTWTPVTMLLETAAVFSDKNHEPPRDLAQSISHPPPSTSVAHPSPSHIHDTTHAAAAPNRTLPFTSLHDRHPSGSDDESPNAPFARRSLKPSLFECKGTDVPDDRIDSPLPHLDSRALDVPTEAHINLSINSVNSSPDLDPTASSNADSIRQRQQPPRIPPPIAKGPLRDAFRRQPKVLTDRILLAPAALLSPGGVELPSKIY